MQQVMATIKVKDVEETFDLYFSRFFGLYFAKLGIKLHLTPTHISIASLLIGIIAGILFYHQSDIQNMIAASILLSLSGILDSADGQLARMTNQSSEIGRAIDGTIDTFVYTTVYVFGTLYFLPTYGYPVVILGVLAGLAHSYKSAVYDFYKMEFQFYVGILRDYRIPSSNELWSRIKPSHGLDKIFNWVLWNNANQQYLISTRTEALRDQFEAQAFSEDKETSRSFIENYRKRNMQLLFWWALICGSNTHRTLMMIFGILGRFDIYLVVCVLKFFAMLVINSVQKIQDDKLLKLTNK